MQKDIAALNGGLRLNCLLSTVSAYANAEASLFGAVDNGHLVLLASSQACAAHSLLGTEPLPRQGSVLRQTFASQRPAVEEFPVSETGSTSTGTVSTVCAVPIFVGPTVTGALLLEAKPITSAHSFPHLPSPDTSADQLVIGHALPRLISSPTLLHQLGLAVSVGLGMDGQQLQWLAKALQRVASCDSMNSLVWELCEDVAAHAKRRYIVESTVRAALLPRADAPLGLLFHAQPCCNSLQGRLRATDLGFGSRSSRLSGEFCGSHLGQCAKMPSRTRLSGAVAANAAAGSDSVRGVKPPAVACFSGEASVPSGRTRMNSSDSAARCADQSPATQTWRSAGGNIVVQLPPHMAAEAPSASLHAQAFPLKHTALQALAAASCGDQPFQGMCIDDVALYLQNVHNPSRDVCLLFGSMRAATGPLSSPRAACGAGSPLTALHAGGLTASGMMSGPGCSGAASAALQSLVLVGLPLGDSVLAFYMSFNKRLPGELLAAVRDSCSELLAEVFSGPVRAKLASSLAAEFETLRTTTPGHFAVLRSASVNGLLHRPRSQGCVASKAARLIAASRASGGVSLKIKAVSGFSDPAATPNGPSTPPAGVAAAAGAIPESSNSSKLPRRTSVDLYCLSQGDVTPFIPVCAAPDNGVSIGLQRTVSFSLERNRAPAAADGKARITNSHTAPQQLSKEMVAVPLANDELMGVLLQMRQSETACSVHGDLRDARSASIMTVTGVDAVASVRQQLDMLVTSIQTTMTTEFNGGMVALSEDLESLELLEVLGKGGGGVVYKGRLGTQEVAVKVMELPDLDVGETFGSPFSPAQLGAGDRSCRSGPGEADCASPRAPNPVADMAAAKEQLRARRALLRNAMEMAVQGRVSHPNLIQVYATYTKVVVERRARPDGSIYHCLVPVDTGVQDLGQLVPSVTFCAIVAELADCGSLAAALSARIFPRVVLVPGASGVEQHPFQLDMRGVYMTLLDVALALRHLHSLNLVHRDIKPANLLLKSNPRDHRGFTVKLADFGFVLHLSETAEDGTRYATVDQACGTVTHMAPELLPGKARVDASADVYSFGILMWELVAGGVRPFPHLHPDLIPRHVYKGARPIFADVVPLTYRGLAHACWATNSQQRPKASDLVTMITAQMQEFE